MANDGYTALPFNKYLTTNLFQTIGGEKYKSEVALFSTDYAGIIMDAVENGGGGSASGEVTKSQFDAEVQARIDGDNTLTTNLNKEIQDRKDADSTLQTNIDQEAENRTTQDNAIISNLKKERDARVDMDTVLQEHIDNEKSARESADSTLQTNIDNERSARLNAEQGIFTQMANYNTVIKDISTDSYPYLKNLKIAFNRDVMIMQGDIYPLANASSTYKLDPSQLYLGATYNVNLTSVLNSKSETLEGIIKSHEVNTDFTKLSANGCGEDYSTVLLNTDISTGSSAVNGHFTCGCKYIYDNLTATKQIRFHVLYSLMKVDTEKTHTFKTDQLKTFFRCPFTIVIPLVTK